MWVVNASAEWAANELVFRLRLDGGGLSVPDALNLTLRSHDDLAIEWFADFEVRRDGDQFVGTLALERAEALVLEPLKLYRDEFSIVCGDDFDPVYIALGAQGTSVEPAEADRQVEELERRRAERFQVTLGSGTEQYAMVAIVDGCLLHRVLQVPGLSIFPITSPRLGGDVFSILEAAAAAVGLPFPDVRPAWMANLRHSHPVVGVLAPDVRADDPEAAGDVFGQALARSLALLALNRSATPRPLASLIAVRGGDHWVPLALSSHEPMYTGNLLGGFASGESPHGLVAQWAALDARPQVGFWLGQANGIRSELRWDARVFRYVALLEAIAREVHSSLSAADDAVDGLVGWDGQPAKPSSARVRLYTLARSALRAVQVNFTPEAGENLWTAVGLWVDVRNAVAHQGGWPRVAELEPGSQRTIRVHEALTSGGARELVAGASALVFDADQITHHVLTAALRGAFD